MSGLEIEKQVCTQPQAEELAGLLEDDAPESLWVWSKIDANGKWGVVLAAHYVTNPIMHWSSDCYPAYTGDELGALLPVVTPEGWLTHGKDYGILPFHSCYYDPGYYERRFGGVTEAQARAALAIKGLQEGWIKKEEFSYEQ